jgi:hypothetical protein
LDVSQHRVSLEPRSLQLDCRSKEDFIMIMRVLKAAAMLWVAKKVFNKGAARTDVDARR